MSPEYSLKLLEKLGSRDRCINAGMNDYPAKPFNPKALVDVLNKWL